MKDKKEAPIQLAVVGHTNTGKTSLLRTLTRDARFGEVSDRAATTRDVAAVDLLAFGIPTVRLFDTPGLEDPIGLLELLQEQELKPRDPVARIEKFLESDHGAGQFEQEAKVLRQLKRSDAAMVVIDAREPVLGRHLDELHLLSECGRPLMPVLNFTVDAATQIDAWRTALARIGLHVSADFDTVVYEQTSERKLFEKLALLLESRAGATHRLIDWRTQQRSELIEACCREVAGLLIDCAALQMSVEVAPGEEPDAGEMHRLVASAEQACVNQLLELFRFELDAYVAPELPLQQGRWEFDPNDPEALKTFGIQTGSAVAAGAVAGLSVDALLGGASLGLGAALGAGAGGITSLYRRHGKRLIDGMRGQSLMSVEEPTLALLAVRQIELLRALMRRGHASSNHIELEKGKNWPSKSLRDAVVRARSHPEWCRLTGSKDTEQPLAATAPIADAIRTLL